MNKFAITHDDIMSMKDYEVFRFKYPNGFNQEVSTENEVIIGYSFEGNIIPEGEGVLTNLTFSGCGNTELCISDAIVSDIDGVEYQIEYGDCVMLSYQQGDVNIDGEINVVDAVLIIQNILEYNEFDSCQTSLADLNGDGSINIVDIVLLVNIILNEEPECIDTDNGATDSYGDTCASWYDINQDDCCSLEEFYECPYNDDDFNSMEMCCACGGGTINQNTSDNSNQQ